MERRTWQEIVEEEQKEEEDTNYELSRKSDIEVIYDEMVGLRFYLSLFFLTYVFGDFEVSKSSNGSKTPNTIVRMSSDHPGKHVKNKMNKGKYWPKNEIPYVFHHSCDKVCRLSVTSAMREWELDTCIRFVFWEELNDLRSQNETLNYVVFRSDQPGCFTVERDLDADGGGQSVNLGEGCYEKYKILHELGHVLNLEHIHTRYDRDLYIQVNTDNILKVMEDQYQKRAIRKEELVPYDYRSIMHYQSSDFSVDPYVRLTMSSKSPVLQYLIDEPRKNLSFYDKKQVILANNCFIKCRLIIICLNQGIPIQTSSSCRCLCPPLTSGNRCEHRSIDPKHHPLLIRSGKSKCGGILKDEGDLISPGYPKRELPFQSCGWVINAPPRHRIEIIFDDFWFADVSKDPDRYPDKCVRERVEIRCRDMYQPDVYCGRTLNQTKIISKNNFLIINIIADDSQEGRGFSARYRFIK
ncbi:zinc metalloproteinase nas-36-like [Brevipalpus obovatus]|uniref:zinc metalloproteinase nas-36-like n=1 Tax=Brevipalpus obovatus TaxID=246614 RepID=UPI003D9E499B